MVAAEAERARLVKEDEGGSARSGKVVRFLPDLSARYLRIVSEMERVLQKDVVQEVGSAPRQEPAYGFTDVAPGRVAMQNVANGSGGALWSHSRGVVCLSDARRGRANAFKEVRRIPPMCANRQPLTRDNVHIAKGENRWRCRQCGRERAAAFRGRQKPAA